MVANAITPEALNDYLDQIGYKGPPIGQANGAAYPAASPRGAPTGPTGLTDISPPEFLELLRSLHNPDRGKALPGRTLAASHRPQPVATGIGGVGTGPLIDGGSNEHGAGQQGTCNLAELEIQDDFLRRLFEDWVGEDDFDPDNTAATIFNAIFPAPPSPEIPPQPDGAGSNQPSLRGSCDAGQDNQKETRAVSPIKRHKQRGRNPTLPCPPRKDTAAGGGGASAGRRGKGTSTAAAQNRHDSPPTKQPVKGRRGRAATPKVCMCH